MDTWMAEDCGSLKTTEQSPASVGAEYGKRRHKLLSHIIIPRNAAPATA